MESRAGKENTRKTTRKEAEDNKLKRRKEKIRSKIDSKRFPPTHQTIQTASQRQPESEGKEDTQMKEESKEKNKGYLPVNLHFKKNIPGSPEKSAGRAIFPITCKKTAIKCNAFTVGAWAI